MKLLVKIVYIICSILFLFILAQPNSEFPQPPSDSLRSVEPGDSEDPLRRAYFTNFDREHIIDHYWNQFSVNGTRFLPIPSLLLNYPPEDATILIRDQTRSTFLQEIVHPFRESLYINGFEPKEDKDTIFIGGKTWKYKIIIKLVPSSILVRLLVGSATLVLIPGIFMLLATTLGSIKKEFLEKWTSR